MASMTTPRNDEIVEDRRRYARSRRKMTTPVAET